MYAYLGKRPEWIIYFYDDPRHLPEFSTDVLSGITLDGTDPTWPNGSAAPGGCVGMNPRDAKAHCSFASRRDLERGRFEFLASNYEIRDE